MSPSRATPQTLLVLGLLVLAAVPAAGTHADGDDPAPGPSLEAQWSGRWEEGRARLTVPHLVEYRDLDGDGTFDPVLDEVVAVHPLDGLSWDANRSADSWTLDTSDGNASDLEAVDAEIVVERRERLHVRIEASQVRWQAQGTDLAVLFDVRGERSAKGRAGHGDPDDRFVEIPRNGSRTVSEAIDRQRQGNRVQVDAHRVLSATVPRDQVASPTGATPTGAGPGEAPGDAGDEAPWATTPVVLLATYGIVAVMVALKSRLAP